jgi:hypothetical protein
LPVAWSGSGVQSHGHGIGNSTKMATIDRSIVVGIPVLAGLAPGDLDEILREARSVPFPNDSVWSGARKRIHSMPGGRCGR